jgi:TldD protein
MAETLLDPALISRLLGRVLAHGGTFAEVYAQKRRSVGLELDDGDIRSASASTSFGVGIRAIRGSAVAYAHSDDLSEEALLECADAVSRIGAAGPHEIAVARPLTHRPRPRHADPSSTNHDAPIETRLSLLHRAYARARHANASLDKILGGFGDTEEDILIANSDGLLIQDRRVLCRLSLQVILKDGAHRRVGSFGGGSRLGLDHYQTVLDPEKIADEAVRMAEAQVGARPAPVGEQVVVLGPASSGILLHEAVGHGLEADFIRKKSSLFAGRIGDRVASELCTVIDDGTIPNARGSLNVDDEGTPTARNVLIENGILKGFMNDRLNAELLSTAKSGNARRESFRDLPLPRMTNTFLAPGQDDPDEILRGVKSGIYCRAFGGGQVDIANGSFVFEVREGYMIEDGKLTSPVQGATLVGNGPDVMTRITRVGSDEAFDPGMYTCGKAGQSVPVTVGLPTVRLDGVTIGGTGDAA